MKQDKQVRPFVAGEQVYSLVEDRIVTILYENGGNSTYPITAGLDLLTAGGESWVGGRRMLFHLDELPITIKIPKQNDPRIKKDMKVRVRHEGSLKWINRYATGELDERGRILCYANGADSFSASSYSYRDIGWDNYEVVEDNE